MQIRKIIEDRQSEILCFEFEGKEDISGLTIDTYEDYFVIAIAKDFHFDGFAYIQYTKVRRLRFSETEQFYSKLFFGHVTDIPKLEKLPKRYSELVSLFCLNQHFYSLELVDELHVGKLTKVNSKSIFLRPISPIAEVFDEYEVSQEEILYITGNTEYIRVYEKYLKN